LLYDKRPKYVSELSHVVRKENIKNRRGVWKV